MTYISNSGTLNTKCFPVSQLREYGSSNLYVLRDAVYEYIQWEGYYSWYYQLSHSKARYINAMKHASLSKLVLNNLELSHKSAPILTLFGTIQEKE